MSVASRSRRTVRSRSSRDSGVYRRPSWVPYRVARRGISRRYLPSAIVQEFSQTDTFTFSITDTESLEQGPLVGIRTSPPLPVRAGEVAGSRVSWDVDLPPTTTILVETTIDNGATWQQAFNGYPVPRLEVGTTTVRAISSRVTMTRANRGDPSPHLHWLDVHVDVDDSETEWTPLGVFDLEDVRINDGPGGVEIELAGSDISARIARYHWEQIFTIPKGTNFGTAIMLGISNRYPNAVFDFASTNVPTPYTITFGISDTDPWSEFQKMAAACGMELYVSAIGAFTLRPLPDPDNDPSVWNFTEDENATITELTREISSVDIRNYIIVTGDSTSVDTAPVTGVAYENDPESPAYILGPLGKRVLRVSSSLITTEGQAVQMAQALLRQYTRAAETVDFSSAPIEFLEPSDVIGITRDASKVGGRFLIDQLRIPLGADGDMHGLVRRQRQSDGLGDGHIGDTPPTDGPPVGSGDDISYPYQIWAGFGSCIFGSGSDSFTKLKDVHTGVHALDYFIHLGDVFYDDGSSNHRSHWNAKFSESRLAALLAAGPEFVYTWSDHDFGFAGNATSGSITSIANSAYRQQFPNLDLPSVGIYRTWTKGRFRFILLDERSFKSPNTATDNSSKTILGATQKAWFKNLIASDDYPIIVIIGDTQWVGNTEAGSDTWYGYSTERAELEAALNANSSVIKIRLEGDSHHLGVAEFQHGIHKIYHAAPFDQVTTKVKQGGNGWKSTYPTNANEGFAMQAYGVVAFTDDGNTITGAFGGFTKDGVQRVGDSWSISVPDPNVSGPVANVGARLKIGSTTGFNHFNIGIGFASGDFDGDHTDFQQSEIQGGLVKAGYFEMTSDGLRAKLTCHVNGHTTPGSNYPRVEFREKELDGTTNKSFDPNTGTHYLKVRGRVTQVAPNKPQLVLAQYHDGSDDTAMIYMDDPTTIIAKLGNTVVGTLTSSFVGGQDYDYGLAVVGNGSTSKVYYYWNDFTTPKFVTSAAHRSTGWYTKFGAYGQSNTSHDSSSAKFIVELTKAECWHTGYPTAVGWS